MTDISKQNRSSEKKQRIFQLEDFCKNKFLLCICSVLFFCINVIGENNGKEDFEFVPEDSVGDMRMYFDASDFLNVSWKSINLLAQGGEILSFPRKTSCRLSGPKKVANEFEKKRLHTTYIDENLMIKRKKSDDSVEYEWGFTNKKTGWIQYNRCVLTKNRLNLTATIEFQKNIPKKIVFNPAIFPGYQPNWMKTFKSERILNKTFLLHYSDGKIEGKKYPNKNEAFQWLNPSKALRALLFTMPEGDVRFSFSSNDSSMKVGVIGNTYFPAGYNAGSQRLARRAPVCEIELHPANLKKGKKLTFHMEIATGIAAKQEATKYSEADFPTDLKITPLTSRDSIYELGQEFDCALKLENAYGEKERNIVVSYEVHGYNNKVLYKNSIIVTLNPDQVVEIKIPIPISETGIFTCKVKAVDAGQTIGKINFNIARVLPSAKLSSPDESFFGGTACFYFANDWQGKSGVPSSLEIKRNYEMGQSLRKLGIRKIRFTDPTIWWKNLEKKEGEATFNPNVDLLIDIIHKSGLSIWWCGRNFESDYPEWGCGEKYYMLHDDWGLNRDNYLPKNMNLYENYIYKVAHHFRGRVKYYEVENEALHSKTVKERRKFLNSFAKGVKRGDARAKVLAGSLGIISHRTLKALNDYLKLDQGYEQVDILVPHYVIKYSDPGSTPNSTTPPPEENPYFYDNFQKLLEIARKYKKTIWVGENGQFGSFHQLYPHNEFHPWQKDFVNIYVRSYILLMQYPEIKNVTIWRGIISPFKPGSFMRNKMPFATCRNNKRWEILPWGVAHATMASLLDGSKFVERLKCSVADFYCMIFEKDNAPIAVIWSVNEPVFLSFEKINCIDKIYNIVGREVLPTQYGKLVKATPEPFYLVGKKGATKSMIEQLKNIEINLKNKLAVESPYFELNKAMAFLPLKNRANKPILIRKLAIMEGKGGIFTEENIEIKAHGKKLISIPSNKLKIGENKLKIIADLSDQKFTYRKILDVVDAKRIDENKYIPAIKLLNKIVVDGKLNDWPSFAPIVLEGNAFVKSLKKAEPWKGNEDLSAKIYTSWDNDYFYIACKVKDDCHKNSKSSMDIWRGDSVQIAIAPTQPAKSSYGKEDQEITIALTKSGPKVFRQTFRPGRLSGSIPEAASAVCRDESNKETFYEIAIPFKELTPLRAFAGNTFRFNIAINDQDKDESIRSSWMQITKGICRRKAPSYFKKVVLLNANVENKDEKRNN